MNDKRGQGLSTNAIILIILGVIVLVILAIGFMVGWDKIAPWIETNNVDTIVQQCGVACNTGSVYDFCSLNRELKDAEGNEIEATCAVFSVVTEFSSKYGVERCSGIDCESSCNEIKINEKTGEKVTTFEQKNCNEFDGKSEECIAKEGECVWTASSSTCTGNYKSPKSGIQEFYDVTELASDISNAATTACGITK